MSQYILVAESGSDIPEELAKQYGIVIVPMHVNFHDKTLDDGSFDVQEILDYYKETSKTPKTSGCNPSDFKIFEELHSLHPQSHFIYLGNSAVTTCSYQSAAIMAQGLDYVTLIDTKQVSIGQGAIVIHLARYISEHPDREKEQIIEYAYKLIERAKMCFIPHHLEFLRAGGRVNNAAYISATLLNIHPTIEILDGRLVATKKYRGKMSKICIKLLQDYSLHYNLDKDVIWFICTIGFEDELKCLLTQEAKRLGFKEINWALCHGVITVHGGPGAFGFTGFKKET